MLSADYSMTTTNNLVETTKTKITKLYFYYLYKHSSDDFFNISVKVTKLNYLSQI